MKHEQLGEAINFYCFPKFFLGEAIANSLLAGAPPMLRCNYIPKLETKHYSHYKSKNKLHRIWKNNLENSL